MVRPLRARLRALSCPLLALLTIQPWIQATTLSPVAHLARRIYP